MASLLCEYNELLLNSNILAEAMDHTKPLVLRNVVLQRANSKNQNGRVYPKEILMREAAVYKQNFVNQRRAIGELDHPESPVVNLKHACCNIVGLRTEGDSIIGDIEILTTPSGNIVRELIKNNVRLGVSSRGMGSVKQVSENTVEVQQDYSLICFDIVSNPSTIGAFINENKTLLADEKYTEINTLVYDFISELR